MEWWGISIIVASTIVMCSVCLAGGLAWIKIIRQCEEQEQCEERDTSSYRCCNRDEVYSSTHYQCDQRSEERQMSIELNDVQDRDEYGTSAAIDTFVQPVQSTAVHRLTLIAPLWMRYGHPLPVSLEVKGQSDCRLWVVGDPRHNTPQLEQMTQAGFQWYFGIKSRDIAGAIYVLTFKRDGYFLGYY